jgi:ABC-type multidrug transport system fused ATPase/permease subunit
MRFYDPDEGEIYIDGRNLREYRVKDLRRKISIVSQDIHLWNRSIRDNLTYVDPNITEEQIRQAVRIAQLYDFIESLPEKYDTIIGDRGLKLSGGERQRLAIARTILRNPQIILLDEPTSALDALTEELLQKELEKLFRGKTVIVVAHRFATIRSVDRIIVVDNGRIVEDGIHSALMKHQGIYYEMYSKQFMEQMSQEKALGPKVG